MNEPISATLTKADQCEAEGIRARSSSPVLAMCRKLIAAGFDPARPLHAYRGSTLALTVRSIGEGAKLQVASNGVGFAPAPALRAAPPMRSTAMPATALAA